MTKNRIGQTLVFGDKLFLCLGSLFGIALELYLYIGISSVIVNIGISGVMGCLVYF